LLPENDVPAAIDAVGHGFDIAFGVALELDRDIGAAGFLVDECKEQVAGQNCQLTPDQVSYRAGQVNAEFSIDKFYFMYFLNIII
jgi:hypothetical protein